MVRLFRGKTPKIKDEKGEVIPNSIASLEQITLGEIKQWILIRSHNVDNPLLLFLHGGPGSAEMFFSHKFERKLEEHFLFVNWDQRGAGKSFSKKIPKESMNIEQFISDAHELIQHLMKRFKKEKIVLVGHSWGSMLSVLLLQRYPELFSAYVGVGQATNLTDNEKISHQFTLQEAKKRGNKKAVKQLSELQPPYFSDFKQLNTQRKWLNKFGGALYNQTSLWPLIKYLFRAPEYTLRDCIKFLQGTVFTLNSLWELIIQEIDLTKNALKFSVPVYFILGRYDYNTPFELAEEYFKKIQAPKKELIWFEKSAHSPNFEEPEKFDEVMIEKVLKEVK
jgi:pimeloyl-ACP methyl ester carboxylesterase